METTNQFLKLLIWELCNLFTSFNCFIFIYFFFNCMFYQLLCVPLSSSYSPGVMYYHLLLRRETRISGVAPFSFRIGILDLIVHRGQKSYTPIAFGKLWTTSGVGCKILKFILLPGEPTNLYLLQKQEEIIPQLY